ncbi:Major pollen allergen Lol pI [Parasponia andersonii]|uniref:Major pollen allergen Lol pI n=1 Tax=Parasponia andersonii TaxID=3476 RepID=A0A2P5CU97_PARAD|nr:Major pollen allergen Lol pI [Parasponia andersonii]
MGFTTLEKQICTLLGLVVLFPAFCTSQFTDSRATYYGSRDCYGTPTGACGFGEYGSTVNHGYVSGVSRLYANGSGCGACYQVRCKNHQVCNSDGVNIVVTDYGEGDRTDFILSSRAYSKLALPNTAKELFSFGVVEVEYRRISCQYSGYNVMYKVNEHSHNPHYLALLVMYVGGQNDVTAVEIWQEDCKEWRPMRRAYGAVWDMENPPIGAVTLRFQATSSTGYTYWVQSTNAIPENWEAGAAYESDVQLTN